MTRVMGQPKRVPPVETGRLEDKQVIAAAALIGGMNSTTDPADIPNEAQAVAKNVRYDEDNCARRGAWIKYATATKPDSDKVRRLIEARIGGIVQLARITNDKVYLLSQDKTTWTDATAAITWTLLDREYPQATVVTDRDGSTFTVLANGTDKLREVTTVGTVVELKATAPRARFVAGFADRVIAASVGGSIEGKTLVQWSSLDDLREFSPAIGDETAGSGVLRTSSVDTSDIITGLVPFGNTLLIPRENSIWSATRTRIAAKPLNFYEAVPRIGCDVPGSLTLTSFGIMFLSLNIQDVFLYAPGSSPQPVGEPIRKELIRGITDIDKIFSGFDYKDSRYYIGIEESDRVKLWLYNARHQTWAYDEIETALGGGLTGNFTGIGTLRLNQIAALSYSGLSGIYSAQTGPLSNWGVLDVPFDPNQSLVLIGTEDGEVLNETDDQLNDFINGGNAAFNTEIRSKQFRVAKDDILTNELRLLYTATTSGEFVVEFSKDGGTTWTITKTRSFTATSVRTLFKMKKLMRTRRIQWRIRCTSGIATWHEFEMYAYPGGESLK